MTGHFFFPLLTIIYHTYFVIQWKCPIHIWMSIYWKAFCTMILFTIFLNFKVICLLWPPVLPGPCWTYPPVYSYEGLSACICRNGSQSASLLSAESLTWRHQFLPPRAMHESLVALHQPNLSCEGPERRQSNLGEHSPCHNYTTLLMKQKDSHRPFISE